MLIPLIEREREREKIFRRKTVEFQE